MLGVIRVYSYRLWGKLFIVFLLKAKLFVEDFFHFIEGRASFLGFFFLAVVLCFRSENLHIGFLNSVIILSSKKQP